MAQRQLCLEDKNAKKILPSHLSSFFLKAINQLNEINNEFGLSGINATLNWFT